MKKGLIYRSTGSWHIVESGGVFIHAELRGNLRLKGIKSTNPVAVGDRVIFEVENNSIKPEGKIIEVEERENYIIRKSVKSIETNSYYCIEYRSSFFNDYD